MPRANAFLLSSGCVLAAARGVSGSPSDPIVGFEAFYGGAGAGGQRTAIVAVARSGAVKRVWIEPSGEVSYIEEGNVLTVAGVGGPVIDCERDDNSSMWVLTASGDLISAIAHTNPTPLDWYYRGNIFALAGVPVGDDLICGTTEYLGLLAVTTSGRIFGGESVSGPWRFLGTIEDLPVGTSITSWGSVKARYR